MTYLPSALRPTNLGDRYIKALSFVLLGYAVMGKGFAYLGYPPLFVGEMAYFAGVIVLLRSGCLLAVFASGPSLLLVATMGWTMIRTVPFVGTYGFDALRDSVLIMYGGFAFIVAALLIEDCRRINRLVDCYRAFTSIYVPAAPVLFPIGFYFGEDILHVPGTTVSLIWLSAGEVGVHIAGVALFALAGFRKFTPVWTVCLLAALVMASAVSRGAMLAFVVPVAFASIVFGKARILVGAFACCLALLVVTYAIEMGLSGYQEPKSSTERRVSAVQLVDNVTSIFGSGGEQTEGTKVWREKWWAIIIENTLRGPHFWTGRGFGVNLAFEDGFGNRQNDRPLRSPHNVNMTIMARAGIPGLALWGLFFVTWLGSLLWTMLLARRRGQTEWVGVLTFIACYAIACLINASFDVALEAPMQGIWFWCLIGFGIGATMIYRYLYREHPLKPRSGLRFLPPRTYGGSPLA